MAQDAYAAPSIQASSAAWSDFTGGGIANILNLVIAANPAIASPTTAPTVVATGGGSTGGNLPAGTYYVSYTWTDGAGETIAKEIAASFTIAAGNIPQVTIPALPTGASSANIYLTAAGGASGTEVLYATGVTTTTFNMSYAGPADPAAPTAPTVNRTGAATISPKLHKWAATGGLDLEWIRLSNLASQYAAGQPVGFQVQRAEIRKIDYMFAVFKEVTREVLTLIAGQSWSLHNVQTSTQNKVVRTFP